MSDWTTSTAYSHTREEMRERLIKDGWHTWYSDDYWVHPDIVSNPKIQDYTNYGMKLEDAFMFDKTKKINLSRINQMIDWLKKLTTQSEGKE